jgi:hypothetical protein
MHAMPEDLIRRTHQRRSPLTRLSFASPLSSARLMGEERQYCLFGALAGLPARNSKQANMSGIIASRGEHVHEKVLHIQKVNGYASRFKKWPARFNGVATKGSAK